MAEKDEYFDEERDFIPDEEDYVEVKGGRNGQKT